MLFPVLVGAGTRLFSTEEAPLRGWTLTEHRTSPSGVSILFYEPATGA